MKEKSFFERVVMLLGVLVSFLVGVAKLLFSLFNGLRKVFTSEQGSGAGTDISRVGDQAKQIVSGAAEKGQGLVEDVKQRAGDLLSREGESDSESQDGPATEPDVTSGEDTVVAGFGEPNEELSEHQHEDIGGVTNGVDVNTSAQSGGFVTSRGSDVSDQTVSAADPSDYGSGINEGVPGGLYEEDLNRQDEPRLDEGIPNLGEPVGVEGEDFGTYEEEMVEEVMAEGDEDDDTDNLFASNQPFIVSDVAGQADIPAASRGLREPGEEIGDELDIEDISDTDNIDPYEDFAPSGAGGEVDLENDESPSWDESEMTIVESPDDPVSADEMGAEDDDTPTLGLRDSESLTIAGTNDDVSGAPMPKFRGVETRDDDHLGVTGDFDQADATETIEAAPGDTDTVHSTHADPREDFVTGDAADLAISDVAGDEDFDSAPTGGEYGETDAFGMPETADVSTGDVGSDDVVASDAFDRFITGHAAEVPDELSTDDDHLGISGNFGEADRTETIPAAPADPETAAEEEEPQQETFVTGEDGDADTGSSGEGGADPLPSGATGQGSGPSAAWSTSAGFLSTELTQPSDVNIPGGDEGGSGGSEELPTGEAGGGGAGQGDGATDVDVASSGAAGESPAAAINQHLDVVQDNLEESLADDAAYVASASAGDLGTTTGPDVSATAGTARQGGDTTPDSGSSRKSRKQRAQDSDWVPNGAVKGDGSHTCPAEYPIKGNANSRIYHRPEDSSYDSTIAEYCFASEQDATAAGFRARKG